MYVMHMQWVYSVVLLRVLMSHIYYVSVVFSHVSSYCRVICNMLCSFVLRMCVVQVCFCE